MKSPRDSRARMTRCFAIAVALILLGATLAVIEFQLARKAHGAEFERTFAPHEYGSPVTMDLVPGRDTASTKRIRFSAPLENAWMNITATVLRADGTETETRRLYIDFFLKPKRGIHWTWGLPIASTLVTVPAEGCRLRLEVAVAPASATFPPLRVEVLPAVSTSHARLIACAISVLLGVGLLLRSLANANHHTPSSLRSAHAVPVSAVQQATTKGVFPSGRLHFIDGLRGIAALSVLLCHLFFPAFLPGVRLIEEAIGKPFPELMRTGKLGVEVFFVISGFVIAYSIRHHRVTPGFILRFIARRFLRLDPPYYAAIFLAIVLMAYPLADSLDAAVTYFQGGKGLLINALYLQDIFGYRSPFGSVAWTLCLEVQFYLALVTLTGISHGFGGLAASPVARATLARVSWWLLFGTLGVASVIIWHRDHYSFNFIATWYRFLLGVLTFRCLAARANPWPFAALLGVLFALSITFSDARGCAAAATAGLILLAGRRDALGRWLDGGVWQFLGRLSYSLYLFHIVLAIPFLAFVWSRVPQTLTFAVLLIPFGLVVAISCAWGMYSLIERPSVALSQRVRYRVDRLSPRDAQGGRAREPLADTARTG